MREKRMSVVNNCQEAVEGCMLHFIEAGDVSAKDIILLHGMKFKASTWQELGTLSVLAAAGCHALALDLPGFGGSPECADSPDQVLVNFIKHKKLEKPVLIGPSMGGRVCLEFCLNHPDTVGALILIGSVGVQENKGKLADVKVPTLIVWGGEDAVSPIENGRLLNEMIEKSTFFVIDGAPHPCYLEQPEIWHQQLIYFLEKI